MPTKLDRLSPPFYQFTQDVSVLREASSRSDHMEEHRLEDETTPKNNARTVIVQNQRDIGPHAIGNSFHVHITRNKI